LGALEAGFSLGLHSRNPSGRSIDRQLSSTPNNGRFVLVFAGVRREFFLL
jgi:hypothetical protein